MRKWLLPVIALLVLVLAACQQDQTPDPEPQTIVEVAQENEDLSLLVEALVAAELVATLEGEGPFTVFAPTNAAFEALFEAQGVADLDELIADLGVEAVANILRYHVAIGSFSAEALTEQGEGTLATALEGNTLAFAVVEGDVVINDTATVVEADIEASNGIIHIIDAVLLPPEE